MSYVPRVLAALFSHVILLMFHVCVCDVSLSLSLFLSLSLLFSLVLSLTHSHPPSLLDSPSPTTA